MNASNQIKILILLSCANCALATSGNGDNFNNDDWQNLELALYQNPSGTSLDLITQARTPPPPSDDTVSYNGSPGNWSSSYQLANMCIPGTTIVNVSDTGGSIPLSSPGTDWPGTGILFFLWANRSSWNSGALNKNPNPIDNESILVNPGGSPDNTVRLKQPLAWTTSTAYVVGDLVYYIYDGGSNWWRCKANHTSGSFSSDEAVDWMEIDASCIKSASYPNGTVVPPACRFEYSTVANAVASNLAQARWLAGVPAQTYDSTGYLDTATVNNNGATLTTTHCLYADVVANADAYFASRAHSPANGVGEAVNTDGFYLPPLRLTDCWIDYTPGTTWTTGQLIRDQGNLLPNNFEAYDKTFYTDAATGLTPSNTAKTFASSGGYDYCQLTGINQAIRQKYLVPATTGVTYELQVTGIVQVHPTQGYSWVHLQVFGLDGSGDEVAGGLVQTAVETIGANTINGDPLNPQTSVGKPFTFTQKFSDTSGTGVLAWPAGSTWLRFGVISDTALTNGTPPAEMWITSMRVVPVPSGASVGITPAYWRCLTPHTSPASSGTTAFATFAADRASNPAVFSQQQVGVQLDYEVDDLRDPCGVATAFADLHNLLNQQGYQFFVYTNSLDNFPDSNGLTSVATGNGFAPCSSVDNLTDVLNSCDLLTAVVSGTNYRGNDILGLAAANYNRMRYVNGTYPGGTDRFPGVEKKIGFALELADKGEVLSAAITNMVQGAHGINITAPGNGAAKLEYVTLNGLNGALGANFNGKTYRVYSGGDTFVIDKLVTSVDPGSGVVSFASSLPSLVPYAGTGGGIAACGGWTIADFQAMRDNYFTPNNVTHFELWPDGAVEQTSPPPSGIQITKITVVQNCNSSALWDVLVDTSADVTTGFPNLANKIYIDGLTDSGTTQLNGSVYNIDTGQSNPCAPDQNNPCGYTLSGTHFLLIGYNGNNIPIDNSVNSGAAVYEATSRNVNQRISALVGFKN